MKMMKRRKKKERDWKRSGERERKAQLPRLAHCGEVPVYLSLPLSQPFLQAQVPPNCALPTAYTPTVVPASADHALSTPQARALLEWQDSWHTTETTLPQLGNHFVFVFVVSLAFGIVDVQSIFSTCPPCARYCPSGTTGHLRAQPWLSSYSRQYVG